ncbi:B3 domain-containing transcription factor VRN1-like [Arachis ipaensis]|uniref:B3 domain-containing transcription factor VRN1-like n=1 Tax=Arachis ipaensis TaxID=130454 RepID=UPI0007AFB664|nr:B3 domain-containing transcription factor VRN1-like [Arachis ipaensis]
MRNLICELQRVPDNFLRKYGGELSSFVNLSVPEGSSWHVGLKKVDNKFWFIDGWAEFVQRYSIGVGYLLAFRYEGKLNFSVHIFNLATAEINYQSPTRSSNEGSYFANRLKIFEEMEDEDFTESKPALQNLFNGSKLNSVNWGEGGNALPAKSARDIGFQFNAIEFKKSTDELKLCASFEEKAKKTARKKRKSKPGSAKGQEASDEQKEEREMRIRLYESASARKRTVTAEEREKVVNEAKAFEPKFYLMP